MPVYKHRIILFFFLICLLLNGCNNLNHPFGKSTIFISDGESGGARVFDTIPNLDMTDFKLNCEESGKDGKLALTIYSNVKINRNSKFLWYTSVKYYPFESCIKMNLEADYVILVLEHEILHAKIMEFARRRFNYKLDSINKTNTKPISFARAKGMCAKVYKQVTSEEVFLSHQFDSETRTRDIMKLSATQDIWINRLDSLLNEYSAWNKKDWKKGY